MESKSVHNSPNLWRKTFPTLAPNMHKYHRGHAAIFGAPKLTGATRLAATACSRIGAGLVTVIADIRGDIYRASLAPDIMVSDGDPITVKNVSAMLGGPGGISNSDRIFLLENSIDVPRCFDAGAIPVKKEWGYLNKNCVLTPHDGEFRTVFPGLKSDAPANAVHAANMTKAIVVLKGPQTYIAHPDGRLVENNQPNPYLAKAGTGDVLAGFITGLLAQGMPAFEASCAAVWIHSKTAQIFGPGLTACDLESKVPDVLRILDRGKY